MMHDSFHIEVGARLSPFLRREFLNPAFKNLRYVEIFSNTGALDAPPAADHMLLYDLVQKALLRGRSPFVGYAVEKHLIGAYDRAQNPALHDHTDRGMVAAVPLCRRAVRSGHLVQAIIADWFQ